MTTRGKLTRLSIAVIALLTASAIPCAAQAGGDRARRQMSNSLITQFAERTNADEVMPPTGVRRVPSRAAFVDSARSTIEKNRPFFPQQSWAYDVQSSVNGTPLRDAADGDRGAAEDRKRVVFVPSSGLKKIQF